MIGQDLWFVGVDPGHVSGAIAMVTASGPQGGPRPAAWACWHRHGANRWRVRWSLEIVGERDSLHGAIRSAREIVLKRPIAAVAVEGMFIPRDQMRINQHLIRLYEAAGMALALFDTPPSRPTATEWRRMILGLSAGTCAREAERAAVLWAARIFGPLPESFVKVERGAVSEALAIAEYARVSSTWDAKLARAARRPTPRSRRGSG